MRLINFINKKTTFSQQRRMIKAFFIGGVIGSIVTQIILYFFVNLEYNINKLIFNIIFSIVFNFIIASPLIFAYIKNRIKYINLIYKIRLKLLSGAFPDTTISPLDTGISVKVIYDFQKLLKGEVYEVGIMPTSIFYKTSFVAYIHGKYTKLYLEDFINKFDIVDIKEERRRKLNKIQRWLK